MEFVGKFFKDRRLWLISIVVFGLLIVVFDKNNLIEAWRLKQKINALEGQETYYRQKIAEDSTVLEKYAREHYLMKRKEETIYLVR